MKELSQIGFVSIGRAGCSIGKLLYEKGYKVCFIDTHKTDLEYLQNVPQHLKYHIPNSFGTGGDRNKSKQYVEQYHDILVDFIESSLPSKLHYFFLFSSGGGTGSGVSPLLSNILALHHHNVSAITIFPSNDEDTQTLQNSLDCMREITHPQHPVRSTFIIDNKKGDKYQLNNKFISQLDNLFHIPQQQSILESIDFMDILSALNIKGYAMTTSFQTYHAPMTTIKQAFYNSLNDSISPQPEYNRQLKSLLISYGIPEDINLTNLLIDELSSQPTKKYENFTNRNSTISLLTGLTYPFNRLTEIKELAMNRMNNYTFQDTKFDFNIPTEVDFATALQNSYEPKKDEVSYQDLNSLFAKYR